MDWTFEVVVVPVSDVDRAKAFYADKLGFNLDYDTRGSQGYGPVQLTPPGSGCSVVLGRWGPALEPVLGMPPGSLRGLRLVVANIRRAHTELAERGVEVGPLLVFDGHAADPEAGFRPARDDDALDNVGFFTFSDPDGNSWGVQQISARG